MHKPHVRTSVSGGPDGVRPENFSWSRHETPAKTKEYRKQVCEALAVLANKMMAEGGVPDEAALNRTVVLLKPAKPGAGRIDKTDPKNYRAITMSNVVGKLFGLVLAKRLGHWAVANGVISEEQCGFMPGRATEDCVLTLLEAVKDRRSRNTPTYVAFIDLKAAYDTVHPEALWRCLRHMGIPDSIVKVLADWSSRRMTQLEVNGERSAPFPMRMGVAQGDILSPLLFNFFSDSLTRYLKKVAEAEGSPYAGLRVGDMLITELRYADDSAVLAESPEALGHAVKAFHKWCKAWGFTINTAAGKSEAMAFHSPFTDQTDPDPIELYEGGEKIKWVKEYRYLGLIVTPTLDLSANVQRVLDRVENNWNQYFRGTSLGRKSPPAAAFHLFKLLVYAAFNYLAALLPPSAELCNGLDKLTLKVARTALKLPKGMSDAAVWAECGLLPAAAVIYRDRYRLYWKLKLASQQEHLKDIISVQMFRHMEQRAIEAGAPYAYSASDKEAKAGTMEVRSWLHLHFMRNFHMHGSLNWHHWGPLDPTTMDEISPLAARCARAVAAIQWHKQLDERLSDPRSTQPTSIAEVTSRASASSRPPGRTTAVAITAYMCPLPLIEHAHRVVESPRHATSLSTPGPGGAASLLPHDAAERPSAHRWAITAARGGTSCLYNRLFFSKNDLAAIPDLHANKHRELECRRCKQQYQCPHHVYLECPHAPTAEARTEALQPGAIRCVFTELFKLLGHAELYRKAQKSKPDCPEAQALRTRKDTLATARDKFLENLNAAALTPAQGFILRQLLAVAPWSAHTAATAQQVQEQAGAAATVDAEAWEFAVLLGECFDDITVKAHLLRDMIRSWVDWASLSTFDLAMAWKYDCRRTTKHSGYDSDSEEKDRPRRNRRGRTRASGSRATQPAAPQHEELPPRQRRASARLVASRESATQQGYTGDRFYPLAGAGTGYSSEASSFDGNYDLEEDSEDESDDESDY
jgi:hypothetical protein